MIGLDQSVPSLVRLRLLHTVQLRVLRLGFGSQSVLDRLALVQLGLLLLILHLLLALGDLRSLQVLAHLGVLCHFGLLDLSDLGVLALAGGLPCRSLDLRGLWLRALLLSLLFSGFWLLLDPFRFLFNPFVASLVSNLINGIQKLLFLDLCCSN